MLAHVPKVKDAFDRGTLAFGTVDAWLVYRLNGGAAANVFVSDSTNASRTMFVNLETLRYDDVLLDFFGIKGKIHLPKIVPSSDPAAYGVIANGVLARVPIMGCLGDQSSALVGQKGFSPGMAKNTYGTGCFLLYNVGEKPVISKHGLLATVAYDFGGKPVYALEGSIAVAGSGVKFLQNNLSFFQDSKEVNDLALTVEDNGGCVFVTAFSGLFAPYWIDDAKGTICKFWNWPKWSQLPCLGLLLILDFATYLVGITQYTQKGHIARATLEATCFQTKAILDAMEKDSGKALSELAVDGGMSNSDLAMQVRISSRLNLHTTPNQPNHLAIDTSRPNIHPGLPPQNARNHRPRRRNRRRSRRRHVAQFRRTTRHQPRRRRRLRAPNHPPRERGQVRSVGESSAYESGLG